MGIVYYIVTKCLVVKISIDFDMIHYIIIFEVVSFFMIFNEFDFMFLLMYCYFKSIKLIFS